MVFFFGFVGPRQSSLAIHKRQVITTMKVVRRPTDQKGVRHSNGKTVSEFGHLISVIIRTALVTGNSKLNFYDPNIMNITIRHKIYCPYLNPIREFRPRKKNYMYPQYPFVSDPFSSLATSPCHCQVFFLARQQPWHSYDKYMRNVEVTSDRVVSTSWSMTRAP
jgi:hypothetical protein